jgi:hypothetical protein
LFERGTFKSNSPCLNTGLRKGKTKEAKDETVQETREVKTKPITRQDKTRPSKGKKRTNPRQRDKTKMKDKIKQRPSPRFNTSLRNLKRTGKLNCAVPKASGKKTK